jgi:hypothetical protein
VFTVGVQKYKPKLAPHDAEERQAELNRRSAELIVSTKKTIARSLALIQRSQKLRQETLKGT